MNNKFEDCLYKAGLTANGCWDELGTYEQEAIEKFFELIVRECLSNMEDCDGDLDFAIWKTKKDFGVEE